MTLSAFIFGVIKYSFTRLTSHLATSSPFLQVNQGTVLAVGPGRRTNTGDLIPPAVKEGDKVLLPEYGGTPVKLDNSGEKE